MSTKVIKNDLLKAKKKNSFCTINVQKISLNSNFKNLKLSNKNNIPRELIHRTINTTIINSNKNKNKLIIPNLVNTINLEKRRKKNIQLRNFPTLKLKNFSSSFINSNYFDINNNNYFVNLYNTSNPKIVKKENISKKIVTKENKNLVNKIKYFKLKNLKKNINLHIKAKSFERKKYSLNDIKINEADKKMKNYRNKLLLEFMKHFKNVIISYIKKYFIFFIKQILVIRNSGISSSYIYKKKLHQTSKLDGNNLYFTYNNSSKRIYQKEINNKVNMKYSNLSKKLGEHVINKIMSNQSKDILNEEVRNVFFDSNTLVKNNFQKKKEIINESYQKDKRKIDKKEKDNNRCNKLKNVINIGKGNKNLHLKFKQISYIENKKKKNECLSNIDGKFVDSFNLVKNKNISDLVESRKKSTNKKRKNLILSSIIEVDEKISSSNKKFK